MFTSGWNLFPCFMRPILTDGCQQLCETSGDYVYIIAYLVSVAKGVRGSQRGRPEKKISIGLGARNSLMAPTRGPESLKAVEVLGRAEIISFDGTRGSFKLSLVFVGQGLLCICWSLCSSLCEPSISRECLPNVEANLSRKCKEQGQQLGTARIFKQHH